VGEGTAGDITWAKDISSIEQAHPQEDDASYALFKQIENHLNKQFFYVSIDMSKIASTLEQQFACGLHNSPIF